MSIETVREKFRWGREAGTALKHAEQAIAAAFTAPWGFRESWKTARFPLDAHRGTELNTAIAEACDALFSNYYNTRHPRSVAHMVPPPATASVIGDLLKGVSNQCAFTWQQGPLVPAFEAAVLNWMAGVLGFGDRGAGLFTSGGTLSNYIAAYLALARAKVSGKSQRPCIIASDQAHFSIHKAASLIGIGRDALFLAPAGSDGRLSPRSLMGTADRALERGYRPVLLVCTAGTTNAGVLEPVEAFDNLARRFAAWLHIDGAHGAFCALRTSKDGGDDYWRPADSVSWDPHKTLFVSYPAGALIVRNKDSLSLLECRPGYAFHESAPADPAFCHLEGSRGFDALKVWLTIRHIGRDGFASLTDYLLELARHLAMRVRQQDQLRLVTSPDLNIVCFRYVGGAPACGEGDALNAAVAEDLYRRGDVLLSRTTIGGRVVLRAVLQNPFTTKDDIDRVVTEVLRSASRKRRSRPTELRANDAARALS